MTTSTEHGLAAAIRARDPSALALVRAIALVIEPGNLVARPWGGHRLAERAGLPTHAEPIGESFELAACPSDDEARAHPSLVALPDGSTIALATVLHACPDLLGEDHVAAYGPELPLLPKLLDLASLLSVQAHPPDHPEAYVILAADPGATMRIGFREDTPVDQLLANSDAGLAAQTRLVAKLRSPPTDPQTQRNWDRALAGHDDELTALFGAAIDDAVRDDVALLRDINHRVLDRMRAIEVTPGMVVHNWAPHPVTGRPTAALHALGDPSGKSVVALEVRLAGTTYRVWDHARIPMRPLDARGALAHVSTRATSESDVVVHVPPEAESFVSVDDGVFVVEHLRPRPEIRRAGLGVVEVLHCTRGRATIVGPGASVALAAGRTALVPAGWASWAVRAEVHDTELVATRMHVRETRLAARTRSLARVRRCVADSAGPREVILIANGGDGPLVRDRYDALAREIFRADGAVELTVHEEVTRRGQLLGLLDATAAWSVARGARAQTGVALGIMLPGQGTRLSPITHRMHGIKPFAPMPIRSRPGGAWLDAGAASLFSWVGVVAELERMGFSGIAWKWGDEPQFASNDLSALQLDLSRADAVRFGIAVEITDDLATNKEWLVCDRDSRLALQLRRRPRAELLARLATVGPDARALVHIGSPALSHAFVAALREEFGTLEGWLDIDGYLFEALTHDDDAWHAEIERDAGLRTLLQTRPDFHARAHAVRRRLEDRSGRALHVAVVDFGADTYWGDMGQLARARQAFAELGAASDHGEFVRRLAAIDDVVPDARGNRLRAGAPGPRVRDSVVVEGRVHAEAERVVVWRTEIGAGELGPGTVVVDSTCAELHTGTDALVVGAVTSAPTRIADETVLTTLPRDPRQSPVVLEPWSIDARLDPGAPPQYAAPLPGNPGTFADKFVQMRQRTRPIADVESDIRRAREHVLATMTGSTADDEPS